MCKSENREWIKRYNRIDTNCWCRCNTSGQSGGGSNAVICLLLLPLLLLLMMMVMMLLMSRDLMTLVVITGCQVQTCLSPLIITQFFTWHCRLRANNRLGSGEGVLCTCSFPTSCWDGDGVMSSTVEKYTVSVKNMAATSHDSSPRYYNCSPCDK